MRSNNAAVELAVGVNLAGQHRVLERGFVKPHRLLLELANLCLELRFAKTRVLIGRVDAGDQVLNFLVKPAHAGVPGLDVIRAGRAGRTAFSRVLECRSKMGPTRRRLG
jgi:hypothetical protein